jgi:hypothetical protein
VFDLWAHKIGIKNEVGSKTLDDLARFFEGLLPLKLSVYVNNNVVRI